MALGLSSAERIKEKQQKERCPGVNPKWKLGKGFPSKDAAFGINSQNIYELVNDIKNFFTKCSLGLPYSFVPSTIFHRKDTGSHSQEAQELLPEAPPEASKVLASLLATDPGVRAPRFIFGNLTLFMSVSPNAQT